MENKKEILYIPPKNYGQLCFVLTEFNDKVYWKREILLEYDIEHKMFFTPSGYYKVCVQYWGNEHLYKNIMAE